MSHKSRHSFYFTFSHNPSSTNVISQFNNTGNRKTHANFLKIFLLTETDLKPQLLEEPFVLAGLVSLVAYLMKAYCAYIMGFRRAELSKSPVLFFL